MRTLWRGRGRHRVEDFARSVEDGAAACPDDPRTSRLVGLANALRSVPLRPSPELTLALRRRIVNAARASCPEEPRSLLASLLGGLRLKRGLPSTAVLLTAVVALVSIGFGATQALPGDALYGLKLRGESITIALAHSDEAKGYGYLRFAGARLRDVSGLIDHDGTWREATVTTAAHEPSRHLAGLVNSTLTTMNGYTDKGAASLRRAYQRTADPAPLAYLDDFTRKQHRTLSGMLGKLPAASQAVAGASLNLVDRLANEASELLTEQCSHALTCQSQGRPSDKASPGRPTRATPSREPATSKSRDITTGGSPGPGGSWQGTSPQRVPSSSQQPPGATTGPASSDGSKSGSDTQQTSPPSTGTGTGSSSGGDGSGGSSTSGGSTGTSTSQPSPPSPTGVPTTSGTSGTGTDSGAQSDTSSGTGATPDTSSPTSPTSPASPSSTPPGSSSPRSSGDSGDAPAPAPSASQPGDPAGAVKSVLPGQSDASATQPAPTPTDQASGSAAASPPAP